MDLLDVFDFTPRSLALNHVPHKRKRPFITSLASTLEDHMDRHVGRIIRTLPAVMLELQGESESSPKRRRIQKMLQPSNRSLISTEDGKFTVKLDTSNFSPEDITVKVSGKQLSVSAKHESKDDNSYEFHEMRREFTIPEDVDPGTIASRLSADGLLTIEAPLKCIGDSPAERTVSIQREETKSVDSERKVSESKEQSRSS